jgi:hypothetical protein
MTFLIAEAHDIDTDFLNEIERTFQVRLVNGTNAFAAVFQGERAQLVAMYNEHWGNPDDDKIDESADCLADSVEEFFIPQLIWPSPMRAESLTGFWLTGDASWWSVMDDYGTCVEVEHVQFHRWITSGQQI